MEVVLTIPVAPRTKKNHGDVVFKRVPTKTLPTGFCRGCRRASLPIVLPSEAFTAFQEAALPHLRQQWAGRAPLDVDVHVEAIFWRDVARGDLVGYLQALADILEKAAVLTNDRLIIGWPLPADGGPSMRKDAARPRVELVVRVVPQPVAVQADLFGGG